MVSENTPTAVPAVKKAVIKNREGIVVQAKMQKTVVVEVTRRVRHAKYVKFVTQRKRFMAHDEAGSAKVGDTVIIEETRPLSKNKRWRVKEIVTRATGA
jgi:small subunit ribosomal protein S17